MIPVHSYARSPSLGDGSGRGAETGVRGTAWTSCRAGMRSGAIDSYVPLAFRESRPSA